jgi:hypothetical protein
MKKLALALLFAVLVSSWLPASIAAQEAETGAETEAQGPERPSSVYRLDFVVYEKDNGAVANTRRYSMLLENRGGGQIDTSSDVPVRIGDRAGEVVFQQVSLEIRAQVRDQGDQVALSAVLDIRDFAPPEAETGGRPVSRHVRSQVSSAVALDKPTIVSTVDEAASRRRFELEVTVSRVR